jgi:diacylglycerol kinase (ATP)
MNSSGFNPFFVINPRAGPARNQFRLRRLIAESFRQNARLDAIYITGSVGEAIDVSRQAAEDGFDPIVAIGGDGTINEVANGIYGTGARLGVLPGGSGNGLARHFGIPMGLRAALKVLSANKTLDIDVGWCGSRLFLVTCGVGLDAVVAFEFENSASRGIVSYFRLAVDQIRKYQPQEMFISGDGQLGQSLRPMLVTVANLNQWGAGALIAPQASATDGLLDVVIIKPMSLLRGISLVPSLYAGRLARVPEVSTFKAPTLTIRRPTPGPIHLDGDPIEGPAELSIRVEPQGMKLIVP